VRGKSEKAKREKTPRRDVGRNLGGNLGRKHSRLYVRFMTQIIEPLTCGLLRGGIKGTRSRMHESSPRAIFQEAVFHHNNISSRPSFSRSRAHYHRMPVIKREPRWARTCASSAITPLRAYVYLLTFFPFLLSFLLSSYSSFFT
jgi:hypothetical protein